MANHQLEIIPNNWLTSRNFYKQEKICSGGIGHTWRYIWEGEKVKRECYGCGLTEAIDDLAVVESLQVKLDGQMNEILELLGKVRKDCKLWRVNVAKLRDLHKQYKWLRWKGESIDLAALDLDYCEPTLPEDQPWEPSGSIKLLKIAAEILDPLPPGPEARPECNHEFKIKQEGTLIVKRCTNCGQNGEIASVEVAALLNRERAHLRDLRENPNIQKTLSKESLALASSNSESLVEALCDWLEASPSPSDRDSLTADLGDEPEAIAPLTAPKQNSLTADLGDEPKAIAPLTAPNTECEKANTSVSMIAKTPRMTIKELVKIARHWDGRKIQQAMGALQGLLEQVLDEPTSNNKNKNNTQSVAADGGQKGSIEEKMINGCGPYLYRVTYEKGKRKRSYLGKKPVGS